jgi:zinc transport system ATP-binding protein
VEHSLIVSYRNNTVFTSDSHWLHPLFELHDFLQKERLSAAELFLRDKIAGRAAACMIAYLGITKCHIELVSRRALPVFEKAGIEYSYDSLVEQIDCRTECLIDDGMSVGDAWLFLRKRAGRVEGLSVGMEDVCVTVDACAVLKNLNLELAAGEQMVIHGANGAGKTTLLKCLLGLVKPACGVVRVGDFRVGTKEWMRNRVHTAYVHQENVKNTFPVSAGEVVSIGLAGSRMPASEVSWHVEIAMRRTGCFNLVKRSYHSLSGGEKQRVSLARCLCQHAKVLLFDEPTSFLDREGRDDLVVLLRELCYNETPTILMVSHDMAWIEQLRWNSLELKGGRLC